MLLITYASMPPAHSEMYAFTLSLQKQSNFKMFYMLIFITLLRKYDLYVSSGFWFYLVLRIQYFILLGIPIFSNCHGKGEVQCRIKKAIVTDET